MGTGLTVSALGLGPWYLIWHPYHRIHSTRRAIPTEASRRESASTSSKRSAATHGVASESGGGVAPPDGGTRSGSQGRMVSDPSCKATRSCAAHLIQPDDMSSGLRDLEPSALPSIILEPSRACRSEEMIAIGLAQ